MDAWRHPTVGTTMAAYWGTLCADLVAQGSAVAHDPPRSGRAPGGAGRTDHARPRGARFDQAGQTRGAPVRARESRVSRVAHVSLGLTEVAP